MQEKIRVYALARELDVESKDLVDICRQAGIDVKNQLSSLDPAQRDMVIQLVKRGGSSGAGGTSTAVAAPPKPVVPPQVSTRVRVLDQRPTRREAEPARTPAPTSAPAAEAPAASKPAMPAAEEAPAKPAADTPAAATSAPAPSEVTPAKPATAPAAQPVAPAAKAPETTSPRPGTPAAPGGARVQDLAARTPPSLSSRMRDLNRRQTGGQTPAPGSSTATPAAGAPTSGGPAAPTGPRSSPGVVRRQGPMPHMASPPTMKPKTGKDDKKPEPTVLQPKVKLTPDMLKSGVKHEDILKEIRDTEAAPPPVVIDDEEDTDGKGKVRPGKVAGRDTRHQQRDQRAKERKQKEVVAKVVSGGSFIVVEEDERRKSRRHSLKPRRHLQAPTMPRKGKIPVTVPITIRALSEALGVKSSDLLFKLLGQGLPGLTINSTLDPDLAGTVALDYGAELDIKRPATIEEQVLAQFEKPDKPEDLQLRAPIVTIMGHVDHGKTTLLDKIRQSNVAATEAGGITQVIRAWRVNHGGRPITFLDTPGHEAFTKMRARGAQVTDIAVIVVAADDGVMPQTVEAINHARAAGVSIVVAINKVDVPNANLNKTRQQLYSLNLLPDNMGGDVPFVETSAAKGTGIDLLLDNISILAELKELKADPNKPGSGTCLEAMLSGGEGVRATLLVREGTLRKGDVILCGATYGRVRAMYDDLGRPIQEAGPSVPVRITGLDEVPNADDPFVVVPDLAIAGQVAEVRKSRLQESSMFKREPIRLETLAQAQISELKVIIKADFRGSIEAIKKELEKLYHEEVRVRILHAGIGGITESDVQLALTSPEDTIIVGFNVVPDDLAKRLAEERGIQIREYNIIYNMTNDIKAALEGKLKPQEVIKNLGRAIVRDTFKISRVGTIAGCFVTEGVIERSAKVRLIRQGVVIYPPPDRTASLDSLKRYKDDVREVSRGFECGIKIVGYDDIKVDDVIEAYKIEQVQRTL